jgi:hypothetical protein
MTSIVRAVNLLRKNVTGVKIATVWRLNTTSEAIRKSISPHYCHIRCLKTTTQQQQKPNINNNNSNNNNNKRDGTNNVKFKEILSSGAHFVKLFWNYFWKQLTLTGVVGFFYWLYGTEYVKDIFRLQYINEQRVIRQVESVRRDLVTKLQDRFGPKKNPIPSTEIYLGEAGSGKTTFIMDALHDLHGVISICVSAGTSSSEILNKVCYQINGLNGDWKDNQHITKRVLQKYLAKYGRMPIVLISAEMRDINMKPAQLTQASRHLVEMFNLHVIIDCSENALPAREITPRQEVIEVQPLNDEVMKKLPQFEKIKEMMLEKENDKGKWEEIAKVVLAVCGGVPLILNELEIKLINCKGDKEKEISKFVVTKMAQAQKHIEILLEEYPAMKEV